MKYTTSPSWTEELVCSKCGTKLKIIFSETSDMMSPDDIRCKYIWKTSDDDFVIAYDETRDGERINIKEPRQ
jgi:DNA-directed RNA polymerase subunit RPC12/RpoP